MSAIYQHGVLGLVEEARRDDGQWFRRFQNKGRWGYVWSRWKPCSGKSERAYLTQKVARLPKGVV